MPDQTSFNLLHEPWIPVLRRNGKAEKVGILTALTQAADRPHLARKDLQNHVVSPSL